MKMSLELRYQLMFSDKAELRVNGARYYGSQRGLCRVDLWPDNSQIGNQRPGFWTQLCHYPAENPTVTSGVLSSYVTAL